MRRWPETAGPLAPVVADGATGQLWEGGGLQHPSRQTASTSALERCPDRGDVKAARPTGWKRGAAERGRFREGGL